MESSITDSARLKVNPISNSRHRVRIVAKISDVDAWSSNESSKSSISVQKRDGDLSDGVTISFGSDQNTGYKDSYKLDYCYEKDEDVEKIYSREVKPLLSGVFNGLNTSILAYGARGSGKSRLIQGSEGRPGLASLAMADILLASEENKSSIAISCYEVYHDHIYDLLMAKGQEVAVLEDAGGRIRLKGLSQVPVKSISEFHNIYYNGCGASHKAAAKVTNNTLYRSHKGLIIHVSCSSGSDSCLLAKMNFVDLAGYEDTKRKNNGGSNLGETAWINKSLYTLQNVVKALNLNERIPYRESKLTRMLQDSLGRKNQTLMITCLNQNYCQDTIYTVNLASRSCQVVSQYTIKTAKNAVRPSPVPSPKTERPQSVQNSLKNQGSSLSFITRRKKKDVSSALKGRKLFDGENPVASFMQENPFSDVTSDGISVKAQEEEIMQSTTVKEAETTNNGDVTSNKERRHLEATSGIDYQEKAIILKEDHNLEMEKSSLNESESPRLTTSLRELSMTLKSFTSTPMNIEWVNKNDLLKDQLCGSDTVGLKSPKWENKSGSVNHMEKVNSTPPSMECVNKNDSSKDQFCDDVVGIKTLQCENNIISVNHMEVVNTTPLSMERVNKDPLRDQFCGDIVGTKTPKCENKIVSVDHMEMVNRTPLSMELVNKDDLLKDQFCGDIMGIKTPKRENNIVSVNHMELVNSTPLRVEWVNKNDPLKGQYCGDIVSVKTPMCENKIELVNHMEVANSCTPLESYSARSTGIKHSLVQEYLKFVNSASKDELKQVKGIGEKRANYIMELREYSPEPFKDLDDLKDIGLTTKQISGMMRSIAGSLFN